MSEEFLVRNCAPTLAGLKTANLFSCPCAGREELARSVRQLNGRLNGKGLRIVRNSPTRSGSSWATRRRTCGASSSTTRTAASAPAAGRYTATRLPPGGNSTNTKNAPGSTATSGKKARTSNASPSPVERIILGAAASRLSGVAWEMGIL